MTLRLIEIFLSLEKTGKLIAILNEFKESEILHQVAANGKVNIKVLIPAEQSETLLDTLEEAFAHLDDFRIVILSIEAIVPRMLPSQDDFPTAEKAAEPKKPFAVSLPRVSREELYSDVLEAGQLSYTFIIMVVLSSVVAAIGLIRGNTAIVIGAMVIAPLLGPNMALALAATLGDIKLAGKAKKANIFGILTPIILSACVGFMLKGNPMDSAEIASRTVVTNADIVLALAAGCAGTLSFTLATASALIGVMVAVALLPPLVACGLLLGARQWDPALGALLLAATNLICINLAGVTTFLLQGIRPLKWWQKSTAKKATIRAMIIWIVLLAILMALIAIGYEN
ncbi:MAG: TIGR00341 family protein [Planctomycetes bacterium]|nr:TIGR00341 family protein [Planctomycetota bacterium]